MTLTCPTTTRQPSSKRTQVCVIRPTFPGAVARWNNVDAIAKSRPNVVITVFESVRAVGAGGAVPWSRLGAGTGLALVDVLLAYWFFVRVYRRAVRTGLIARYSAESVL